MSDNVLLSLLWMVPLGGAVLVFLFPSTARSAIRMTALMVTVITLCLTVATFLRYVSGANAPLARSLTDRARENSLVSVPPGLDASPRSILLASDRFEVVDVPDDLVVRQSWIPYFNVQYYLGVDGLNLSLLMLTALLGVLSCLASWEIASQVRSYFALYLILLGTVMGVFLSLDLFLFFVFFEVMLLPMYFLIAIWGGDRREYAAIKFLLFTLFGSALILVAFLLLFFWSGDSPASIDNQPFFGHSFDMLLLERVLATTSYFGPQIQNCVFLLLLAGFLVKLPSFPFHTWLPDAHVEAPTPISMLLAGVLLKIGGYGLVRLAWPLAPAGAYMWATPTAVLGVVSITYGALVAMAQTDLKKLVAYSSISHMGFVTLGLASMSLFSQNGDASNPVYYAYGLIGSVYMMLAHGITSAGMFFLVGAIYQRTHTRDLNQLGGLMKVMPLCGIMGIVIFFGAMGLPGLCGFIGEVFVILSAFHSNPWVAVVAAFSVVLTAGYMLWAIQRVWGGTNQTWSNLRDFSGIELTISLPLVVLTVVLGIAPQAILYWLQPDLDRMARQTAAAPTVRSVFESKRGQVVAGSEINAHNF